MIAITSATYPTLHKACDQIRLDHGGSSGHERYFIPDASADELRSADGALAALSAAELDTMSFGEHSEVEAIAERSDALAAANALLNRFFEDGTDCCDGEPYAHKEPA